MSMVWKLEATWDEYENCPGQILYFHKKVNAQKRLREWLKAEIGTWKYEGKDPTWWPACKTWDDVIEWYVSRGGDSDVAWIDTIKFEDEEEGVSHEKEILCH